MAGGFARDDGSAASKNTVERMQEVRCLAGIIIILITIFTLRLMEGTSMSDHASRQSQGGIILMRHGEAGHNIENIYNSQPDHPAYTVKKLTEPGRSQALETGRRLLAAGIDGKSVCQVLVSPLPRTLETSNLVQGVLDVAENKVEVKDDLIESAVGDREGELYSQFSDRDFWFPDDPESFGGETRQQVMVRVVHVLRAVLNSSRCDLSNQYVLIVSHGVPVYLMLEALTGRGEKLPPAGYRIIHNPTL